MRGLVALVAVVGCKASNEDTTPALFPADYEATYTQVRNCRPSLDHDVMTIRVMSAPEALDAYTTRLSDFPVGSIVLKEQYDQDDTTCSGQILEFTVMQKLAPGSSPATLDWTWQKADADVKELSTDLQKCIGCHTMCGVGPDGYAGTCTVP